GWRNAFLVAGLPGVLLAILVWATVRELPRGYSEPDGKSETEVPGIGAVIRTLVAKPSFLHLCAATTITAFVGYGNAAFAHPFLIRNYHMGYANAAVIIGIIAGVGSSLGTLGGGYVADYFGARDKRWYGWICAAGKTFTVPIAIAAYLQTSW